MSDAFDLWAASKGLRRDVGETTHLREAFNAGVALALNRARRIEHLSMIAGGVSASLLFNGAFTPDEAARRAADIAAAVLDAIEKRERGQ